MCVSHLLYSSVDGRLGCFHVMAYVGKGSKKEQIHVCV